MSNPRGKNMPWLTPYLAVQDAKKTIDFYSKAFGFTVKDHVMDDEGNSMHVEMSYKGEVVVMFAPEEAWAKYDAVNKSPASSGHPCPIHLYVYFEDVDAQFAQALATGGEVAMPLNDTFWGDRYGQVKDPNGYVWGMATHKGEGHCATGAGQCGK